MFNVLCLFPLEFSKVENFYLFFLNFIRALTAMAMHSAPHATKQMISHLRPISEDKWLKCKEGLVAPDFLAYTPYDPVRHTSLYTQSGTEPWQHPHWVCISTPEQLRRYIQYLTSLGPNIPLSADIEGITIGKTLSLTLQRSWVLNADGSPATVADAAAISFKKLFRHHNTLRRHQGQREWSKGEFCGSKWTPLTGEGPFARLLSVAPVGGVGAVIDFYEFGYQPVKELLDLVESFPLFFWDRANDSRMWNNTFVGYDYAQNMLSKPGAIDAQHIVCGVMPLIGRDNPRYSYEGALNQVFGATKQGNFPHDLLLPLEDAYVQRPLQHYESIRSNDQREPLAQMIAYNSSDCHAFTLALYVANMVYLKDRKDVEGPSELFDYATQWLALVLRDEERPFFWGTGPPYLPFPTPNREWESKHLRLLDYFASCNSPVFVADPELDGAYIRWAGRGDLGAQQFRDSFSYQPSEQRSGWERRVLAIPVRSKQGRLDQDIKTWRATIECCGLDGSRYLFLQPDAGMFTFYDQSEHFSDLRQIAQVSKEDHPLYPHTRKNTEDIVRAAEPYHADAPLSKPRRKPRRTARSRRGQLSPSPSSSSPSEEEGADEASVHSAKSSMTAYSISSEDEYGQPIRRSFKPVALPSATMGDKVDFNAPWECLKQSPRLERCVMSWFFRPSRGLSLLLSEPCR